MLDGGDGAPARHRPDPLEDRLEPDIRHVSGPVMAARRGVLAALQASGARESRHRGRRVAGHTTWTAVGRWRAETSGPRGVAVYPALARLGVAAPTTAVQGGTAGQRR